MKRLTPIIATAIFLLSIGLSSCVEKIELLPDPEGLEFCKSQVEMIDNPRCHCVWQEGWVVSCE
jgi:hypothetical protein